MRILHLVHQYVPEHVGGTEIYTRLLASSQSQRGHQVTIFCRRSAAGTGEEVYTEGGVRVEVAWSGLYGPARRLLSTVHEPALIRSLERVLERSRPELVHIQHLMGLPAACTRLLQQRGIPFVITLHDYWWICANAQLLTHHSHQVCPGPRAFWNCAHCALARAGHSRLWPALPLLAGTLAWRNQLLQRPLRVAQYLIAPTQFVRRWYSTQGIPPRKIAVLPHGIDPPPPALRASPRADGPVRLVYIGGIAWQKGIHVVLEALQGLEEKVELWIAGDESYDPAYTRRLRALATPNVRFLGLLAHTEVWETLAQADAVVVPSLWYETYSLITHEAFAAHVAVIASRLGALEEAVRDGIDGLLVPPGDVAAWRAAIVRLVDQPGLLATMRANTRPPMTVAEHVSRIESLYLAARSLRQTDD